MELYSHYIIVYDKVKTEENRVDAAKEAQKGAEDGTQMESDQIGGKQIRGPRS